jgi:hypothetical protein
MEESMRNKDFASVAGGINTALRFYFENHDKSPIEDQIEKYLVSDGSVKLTGLVFMR